MKHKFALLSIFNNLANYFSVSLKIKLLHIICDIITLMCIRQNIYARTFALLYIMYVIATLS